MIWSLLMSLSEIIESVTTSAKHSIRILAGRLAAIIYDFIAEAYNIFVLLTKANILDNEIVNKIYKQVGLLLGTFMIFKLVFILIQNLIEPDKSSNDDKNVSKILTRMVLSVVLLGALPGIFSLAFEFQNLIVGNNEDGGTNILYKLIVGEDVSIGSDNFGKLVASNVFFSFYTDPNGNINEVTQNIDKAYDIETFTIMNIKEDIVDNGKSFDITVRYLKYTTETGEYSIEFNEIFILVGGILVAWIMVTYCIQTAIRVIQLAFLQIIAPIPVLSYISSPDGAFKRWVQQCFTTYLDVFIRTLIIYFIIFLSNNIIGQLYDDTFSSTLLVSLGNVDKKTLNWISVLLMIGLLMFAKRVPELLKELFPSLNGGNAASLGFGLKSPKKTLADIPVVGGLANKAIDYTANLGKRVGKWAWANTGGAVGRGIWNHTGGAIKNRYSNWKEDRKNASEIKQQSKQGDRIINRYGDDNVEQGFHNEDFANSYTRLRNAQRADTAARDELEMAKASGDQQRINNAVRQKSAAERELRDAQSSHDNLRKLHGADARREDSIKLYRTLHPELVNNHVNTTQNNNQQGRTRGDIINNINQLRQANNKNQPTSFTAEEKFAARQLRENSRSSYNNQRENELAYKSIFSDNAAMRQSDIEYNNASVNSSSVSDNDTTTKRKGLFDPENRPPTEDAAEIQRQLNQKLLDTPSESRDYPYSTQENWDERIEFATEKLQELANNGAEDLEIKKQMKILENLQEGKKQSALKDNEMADHLDDFYERQDDGFGGQ